MRAQTSPTMAPAHRVVAPELVQQQAGVHRQRPAEAPEHGGEQIGETVGAKLLIEVAGFLPRDFQARHIEQERDGHDAAKGSDLGAALRDHAPIDLVADHGTERPPQSELAELRQKPGAAHRIVADDAEQAAIDNDEKSEERDRQGKIARHPSRQHRDGDRKQHGDEDLRAIEL